MDLIFVHMSPVSVWFEEEDGVVFPRAAYPLTGSDFFNCC